MKESVKVMVCAFWFSCLIKKKKKAAVTCNLMIFYFLEFSSSLHTFSVWTMDKSVESALS